MRLVTWHLFYNWVFVSSTHPALIGKQLPSGVFCGRRRLAALACPGTRCPDTLVTLVFVPRMRRRIGCQPTQE